MVQEDHVDSYSVGMMTVVGAILTLALVVGVSAYYYHVQKAIDAGHSVVSGVTEVSRVKIEQLAKLQEARVVDAEKKVMTLPIEKAMAQVVASMSREGSR